MQKVMSKMRAAIDRYQMLSDGDRVAVCVSGGKDSLVLLDALAGLRRFYPADFSLQAITLDPCFDGKPTDYSAVEALCRQLEVPYTVRRTELARVIFEERREANPCSLCARMRRGILHDTAKELSCNKLALGHHMDDAAETFYMNLFCGGRISCFSPVSYLSRKQLTMIRPMIYARESDMIRVARQECLPVVESRCPADGNTERQRVKDRLAELRREDPALVQKMIGALEKAGIDGWSGKSGKSELEGSNQENELSV